MFRFILSVKPLVIIAITLAILSSFFLGSYCLHPTLYEEDFMMNVVPTAEGERTVEGDESVFCHLKKPASYSAISQHHRRNQFRFMTADQYFNDTLSLSSETLADTPKAAGNAESSHNGASIAEEEHFAVNHTPDSPSDSTESAPETTENASQEKFSNNGSANNNAAPPSETQPDITTETQNPREQEQELSIPTNSIQEEMSRRKGMIGRLQIPSLNIDVALFDWAKTGEDTQTICDWVDAAVQLPHYSRTLIGDHCHQSFSTLKKAKPGDYMYITDGLNTTTYVCTEVFDGTNITSDLIRLSTNKSIMADNFNGLTLYTCKTIWGANQVIITYWAPYGSAQNDDSTAPANPVVESEPETQGPEKEEAVKEETQDLQQNTNTEGNTTTEPSVNNPSEHKQESTSPTNPIQAEMSRREGMIGRLRISSLGLDVAVFDQQKAGVDSQTIFLWEDAAVKMTRRGKSVIADYSSQGFGVIAQAQPGTQMHITDGTNTTVYVCVEVCSAHYANNTIVRNDTDIEIFKYDFDGLILYTGQNDNITTTYWQLCG